MSLAEMRESASASPLRLTVVRSVSVAFLVDSSSWMVVLRPRAARVNKARGQRDATPRRQLASRARGAARGSAPAARGATHGRRARARHAPRAAERARVLHGALRAVLSHARLAALRSGSRTAFPRVRPAARGASAPGQAPAARARAAQPATHRSRRAAASASGEELLVAPVCNASADAAISPSMFFISSRSSVSRCSSRRIARSTSPIACAPAAGAGSAEGTASPFEKKRITPEPTDLPFGSPPGGACATVAQPRRPHCPRGLLRPAANGSAGAPVRSWPHPWPAAGPASGLAGARQPVITRRGERGRTILLLRHQMLLDARAPRGHAGQSSGRRGRRPSYDKRTRPPSQLVCTRAALRLLKRKKSIPASQRARAPCGCWRCWRCSPLRACAPTQAAQAAAPGACAWLDTRRTTT